MNVLLVMIYTYIYISKYKYALKIPKIVPIYWKKRIQMAVSEILKNGPLI